MRISTFQSSLPAEGVIIESPVDLFYLTGLSLSKGALAVTRKEVTLFVDGRYLDYAKKKAPCPVALWEGDAPFAWLRTHAQGPLAFDSATSSYDQFLSLQKQLPELLPVSGLLKKIRGVKTREEQAALQRAADVTWKGYRFVVSKIQEGISEEELAFEFEMEVRKQGASGLSFDPIIAFGENSAYPHHRAGSSRWKKGQMVLIDVGAEVDHYRGDLTRVHLFEAPPEIVSMLELTRRAQEAAFQAAKPGETFGKLDMIAREVLRRGGMEELFVHGLGHGIGLETHEFPSIKAKGPDRDQKLSPGMVFTLEPGLYRPGVGGVRWEDIVVVTEHGCRRMYPDGL